MLKRSTSPYLMLYPPLCFHKFHRQSAPSRAMYIDISSRRWGARARTQNDARNPLISHLPIGRKSGGKILCIGHISPQAVFILPEGLDGHSSLLLGDGIPSNDEYCSSCSGFDPVSQGLRRAINRVAQFEETKCIQHMSTFLSSVASEQGWL